jgi:putative addiction module component (TIGR02574 family)
MTKVALLNELAQLSARERLEIAYGLLDSVLHDQESSGVSDAQRRELRERTAHYRAHPDQPVVTLEDIRRKLVG